LVDLRHDDPAEVATLKGFVGEKARLDRPETETDKSMLCPSDCRLLMFGC
jgi:hypothetical protein